MVSMSLVTKLVSIFRMPHAFGYSVPGRPRFALSLSSLRDSPAFTEDHTSGQSPSWTRLSSASMKPQLPVGASGLQVISLVQSLVNGTWCPDTPVQRAHPGELLSAGLRTSWHQARLDAKRDLDLTWLKLLLVMGYSRVLTQSTGFFCHAQVHQLRAFSKVALSTSQLNFRIWQHWFDFVSIWYACPSRPATFLRKKFLAAHAHAPLPGAMAYFKSLHWMAKEALHPELMALFHSSVCKAYWLSSTITVHRESALWPLSFVLFLECQRLSKTIAPGDVFAALTPWSSFSATRATGLGFAIVALLAMQCHESHGNRRLLHRWNLFLQVHLQRGAQQLYWWPTRIDLVTRP